LTKVKIIE